MPDTSEDAVRKATGHGWNHWFTIQDDLQAEGHTERVRAFSAAAPDVSGWWCQMITVEWEKARGVRVEGQTCAGDFQVSCSKTVPWDPEECYERIITTPFLEGADWTEGAAWENEEAGIEVRRADPGKMLRWFWHDADGKSTVEVAFNPTPAGKTSIVFRHHQLASLEARDRYRARWKEALQQIAS